MNDPTPLLIISDAPSAETGLGRITRDLATRLHAHCSDIFRVATLGYGGVGSRKLSFPQYYITELREWMVPDLPHVWEDFVGKNEPGVILTIWDPSRLLWFARSDRMEYCRDRHMRQWLQQTPLHKWGYFAIDAFGPNGKLSCMQSECLMGYDRILMYGKWAEGIVQGTLGEEESRKRFLASLPHGIDTDVFKRRDREKSRKIFHEILGFKGPEIQDSELVIGIVATNQARKDFGLAFRVVAELAKKLPIRLFIQTDALERFWSLPALVMDYGLINHSIINCGPVTDEVLSHIYTACDVTLGIGLGEGFGYPIFESLACGTPVISGDYGGQSEWIPEGMMVDSDAMRLEGLYNCFRPVYRPIQWVNAIEKVLKPKNRPGDITTFRLNAELRWENLWPRWEEWFREAHHTLHQKQGPSLVQTNIETGRDLSDHGRSKAASPAGPQLVTAPPIPAAPSDEPA